MAPLPPVAGVLRVEFTIGDEASIEAGSRFFLSYTGGPPNTTDLNTLATDVSTAWGSHMAPEVNDNESLHGVVITDLSSDEGAQGIWTGTINGGLTGIQLPASTCAVMNHQINRRYRGGRPRTYVRFGQTTSLAGTNEWTSGAQSAFLSCWEAWIAAILGTGSLSITLANIVNVSYYSGFTAFESPSGRYRNIPKLRVDGPVVDVIQSTTTASKLGSQRRRLNI